MPPIRRISLGLVRRRAHGSNAYILRGASRSMYPMRSLCSRLRRRNCSPEERSGRVGGAHSIPRGFGPGDSYCMSRHELAHIGGSRALQEKRMKIYNSSTAPNPRRVRIFLAEKGIRIPYEEVDIVNAVNRGSEFRKKNPLATVPVLELDDGTCISESVSQSAAISKNSKPVLHCLVQVRRTGQSSICGTAGWNSPYSSRSPTHSGSATNFLRGASVRCPSTPTSNV
jgi:hypothetical protein